ncbi:MAG: hypothetical protein P4L69_08160 [Desulfosporosinus sp.]|nr:hypothetical protein [Desulfosporosinus sp.]
MEYIVTRWPNSPSTATQQAAITITVNAVNHLEALNLSGLKEPGALISVNRLGGLNIRYQVDPADRAIELAHVMEQHRRLVVRRSDAK